MQTHRGVVNATVFAERYGAKVFTLDAFGEEHRGRTDAYREYWRFYKGEQWKHERPPEEPVVTLNYCKRIVDAQVNFLFKKGFDITIPDNPDTPELEDETGAFVKRRLDDTWRWNKKALVCFELGQTGAVTGDGYVRVSWDPSSKLAPPHPRIEVLPSHFVFPEYGGESGLDRQVMTRCVVVFPRWEEVNRFTFRGSQKKREMVLWYEVWTDESRQVWREDKMVSEDVNWAGEIPIVHIANYPCAGESFGMSDLQPIIDLNREVNEKSTDISDVIQYHGSPVTILRGAKVSQLERGPNRVWSLPADATAENLELSGDLSAAHRYVEGLIKTMYLLAGTPEFALGGDQGGAESGAALALRYLPMLEIRDVKVELYGTGIREINRLALKAWERRDEEFGKKFRELDPMRRYWTDVSFPGPLPRDVSRDLEHAAQRLEMGLSTRLRELRTLGHGESDAAKIIKEADEERQRKAQMEFDVGSFLPGGAGARGGGNPNPKRPDPDRQGEKVSRTAEIEDEQGV